MGAAGIPIARRALLAVAAALVVAVPIPSLRASAAPDVSELDGRNALRFIPASVQDPERPMAERYTDTLAGLAITPPVGWVQSPATALNPMSDPPEPVEEMARFQVRISDPQLYANPIPITSGLVADATAMISIGVARMGSEILDMDRSVRGTRELGSTPGFAVLEEEATYEGLHVLTRYLFARESDRVIVVRAAAAETAWAGFADLLRESLATFGGDANGENAPAPAPPPAPAPAPAPDPAPAEPAPDPTVLVRNAILARASSLLGLRYVWGGNSTANGMDCSAYVSWVWGTSRWSTDSIWNVSSPITKDELRAGDAMNLTTGRDPQRLGHIRIFEAWANTERTAMWVYEETPPRVVHRVVAYDAKYQPVRLAGLSGAGEVRVVPGTPPAVATLRPAAPRPTVRATPRPTMRATPRPTVRLTPRPSASVTPRPTAVVPVGETAQPTATARRTITPTARPTASPTPLP